MIIFAVGSGKQFTFRTILMTEPVAKALANVYRTSQADNRRYYVLNTWLREGLDQLNDLLFILGKGDPASQLHQDLQPFIKQINRNY